MARDIVEAWNQPSPVCAGWNNGPPQRVRKAGNHVLREQVRRSRKRGRRGTGIGEEIARTFQEVMSEIGWGRNNPEGSHFLKPEKGKRKILAATVPITTTGTEPIIKCCARLSAFRVIVAPCLSLPSDHRHHSGCKWCREQRISSAVLKSQRLDG